MKKARLRISIPADDEELVVRRGEHTKIIINASRRISTEETDNVSVRIAGDVKPVVGQPLQVTVTPTVTKPLPDEKTYTIIVHTGNVTYAGTNARVFIDLQGSKFHSKNNQLKESLKHDNPFEKGQVDVFKVQCQDLGCVYQLQVYHDNTGAFPGWYLNKIIVRDDKIKQEFTFALYDWLFKGDSLTKLLKVEGTPITDAICSAENAIKHHTEKFKLSKPTVVLRRGQTFAMDIKLARKYIPSNDILNLVFCTGGRPREKDGTLVTVEEVLPKNFSKLVNEGSKWGFRITNVSKDNKTITIEVFVPPNAMPGKYDFHIEDDSILLFHTDTKYVILFNPWCGDDDVYMEDEAERREYVLKQHGQIFRGHWKYPRPVDWYFGQFEEISLDCVFDLLEGVASKQRRTATDVARLISSKANNCDNHGVLEGRWDGKYKDGRKPTSWNSTPAILTNYQKNKYPVKYGQCWVFSAVVTTVMRALGIPCRPVTNFSSAHDTDANCSIDKYYDNDGEFMKGKSDDSVWNFHVWNDVWMERKDLPHGYGGWQAIDATPQEQSNGIFQMGPASLVAVKEGEIQHKYNTAFVFAEVNAETIYWQKNEETDKWEAIHRNKVSVGRRVSTKAVGKNERKDITNEYKFEEGTVLERASVRKALLRSDNVAVKPAAKDVEVEIIADESVMVGKDIDGTIKISNTCSKERHVTVAWKIYIVRYDGVVIKELDVKKEKVTVQGEKEERIPLKVHMRNHLDEVADEVMVRIQNTALVDETKQLVVTDHMINIDVPDIQIIELPKSIHSSKPFQFTVKFQNPIDQELTDCELSIDGNIITDRKEFKDIGTVKANAMFEHKVTITPDEVGKNKEKTKRSIAATFSCEQLGGLTGLVKVEVLR